MLTPLLVAVLLGPLAPLQSPAEVIAEIRVHGNVATNEQEIVTWSGLVAGAPFEANTIADATAKLRASKRFEAVDVLKRYASITDPSRVLVVIVVNEGPMRVEVPSNPGAAVSVRRRRGLRTLMFLPILHSEDGYGVTYGVRVSRPGVAGPHSRLTVPLSWGGHKQAALEFDRTWQAAPLSRIRARVGLEERTNPHFHQDDQRRLFFLRGEKAAGPIVAGLDAGWQRVSFGETRDRLRSVAIDVTLDTRLEPLLARNAVYASFRIERVDVAGGLSTTRRRMEGRGYLGLVGQSVLVLDVTRDDSRDPLPPYLRPLLGGWPSLRGFDAGVMSGDVVVTGSAELRVPVSSPLSLGKLILSAFVDTGAAYGLGQRLRDQSLNMGVGGAATVSLTAFRLSFSVARGLGAGTRVNVSGGFIF